MRQSESAEKTNISAGQTAKEIKMDIQKVLDGAKGPDLKLAGSGDSLMAYTEQGTALATYSLDPAGAAEFISLVTLLNSDFYWDDLDAQKVIAWLDGYDASKGEI
jgi:hypothetical protein